MAAHLREVNLTLSDAPNAAICEDLRALGAEQLTATSLKITGISWAKVAARMQVAESTIHRWRLEYPIDRCVEAAASDMLYSARIKVAAMLDVGLDALARIADSGNTREALDAANSLVDLARTPAMKAVLVERGAAEHARTGLPTGGGRVIDCVDDFSDLNLPDRREAAR